MQHLGLSQPPKHRATPPLRPPPIVTPLNDVTSKGASGYTKYIGSQSPLTLAREARYKTSISMSTDSCPYPARADPCSVPCSPTLSLFGALPPTPALSTIHNDVVLGRSPTDEILPSSNYDGVELQLSAASPVSPGQYSCLSSFPSPSCSTTCNPPSALEELPEQMQGWVNSQPFKSDGPPSEQKKQSSQSASHKIRIRGRALSESATGLASRVSQWKNRPLSRLGGRQKTGKYIDLLDPIIDSTQESEQEAVDVPRERICSWDIVASKHEPSLPQKYHPAGGTQSTAFEPFVKVEDAVNEDDVISSTSHLSFSVLGGQSEGHFTLTLSDVDYLQYSDLEEQCSRALRAKTAFSASKGDRILLVLSAKEALRLRLIKNEPIEGSCNLVLIEPWTTSVSASLQELLVKESFRRATQTEEKVRLVILERGQSLPSHISASREFWIGWSDVPADTADHQTLSILVQSGAATVVPSRSISRKSESLRVSSHLSRASLTIETTLGSPSQHTTIETKEDDLLQVDVEKKDNDEIEAKEESQSSPADSLLPLQASHFSSETSAEERAKTMTQLPCKRRKKGVRIPALTGAALSLRAGKVFCFKSDTVSPRVTSALLHARRRERRKSRHPSTSPHAKMTSPVWKRKRPEMLVDTAVSLSTPRNGLGGSFRRSNRALKRAAGYFGSRSALPMVPSQPPTPTTASISIAEMCSNLPEGSVENLLCNDPRAMNESTDWRDTVAEHTLDQDQTEYIGAGPPSEKASSISSKRRGWLGNADAIPSIRQSCDLEDEAQEVEVDSSSMRRNIVLENTFGKKAPIEETGESNEPPRKNPSRTGSISSLLKNTLSSLANSPHRNRPSKQTGASSRLRKQVDKLTRSNNSDRTTQSDTLTSNRRISADVVSISIYSKNSFDSPDALPMTGATTADSSPCLSDASPNLLLTPPSRKTLARPASSPRLLIADSAHAPRPARKRESGVLQLQSISGYGSLHRSQSLSMMSEGWMCSNEDLEPEVRDCVSSLSGGRKKTMHLERLNVKKLDWKSTKEGESPSVDSIATSILSSRGMSPGSAPLLQQCSSNDRLRLLSIGSSNISPI